MCVYEYIHIRLTMYGMIKKTAHFTHPTINIQIMQKTGNFLQKVSVIQSSKQ